MKNSPIRHCSSKCRRRNLLNSSCPKCQKNHLLRPPPLPFSSLLFPHWPLLLSPVPRLRSISYNCSLVLIGFTINMEGGDDGRVADIDKMTVTLEPYRITKGGLHVPGKDRMEFRPPERNSLLGLDVLAIAK
ncbi:hypothetical protein MRB53_007112 [Persea americana]|uniref:Uncharacterized protein n=1 Tax=Persea americana TaxID=3435 RepID=A0ACC2MIA7_PERAE|nr:hypothetical protein MRB53_007112 [Persea americana]